MLWAAVALLLVPAMLSAQDGGGASSQLPVNHWAVEAARRAEALGLLPHYLPGQRSVRQAVVANALREAARRALEEAPALVDLTAAWERRFAREFPRATVDSGDSAEVPFPRLEYAAVGAESGWRAGAVAAGRGVLPPVPPDPLADQPEIAAAGVWSASLGRHVNLLAAPEIGAPGGLRGVWDATLGWRHIAVSVGRQPARYGAGERGVVLGSPEPWHRIQAETVEPLDLAGPLRLLGPVAFHSSLGRVWTGRHAGHPWLWTASARARPHPRLTAAVNRAAMFGGDSVAVPVSVENVLRMLGGWQTGGFENQIVSLELNFRFPTEPWIPLSGYIEWGFDDAAGAIGDVPGIVAGLSSAAIPGVPAAAAGIEVASFSHSCCNNPPWYRHAAHSGGWAYDRHPLGHPLGGDGTELLSWLRVDPTVLPLRWEGSIWLRRRGSENLYAPQRVGESIGGSAQLTWRLPGRTDARVSIMNETGGEWRETQLRAALTKFF